MWLRGNQAGWHNWTSWTTQIRQARSIGCHQIEPIRTWEKVHSAAYSWSIFRNRTTDKGRGGGEWGREEEEGEAGEEVNWCCLLSWSIFQNRRTDKGSGGGEWGREEEGGEAGKGSTRRTGRGGRGGRGRGRGGRVRRKASMRGRESPGGVALDGWRILLACFFCINNIKL